MTGARVTELIAPPGWAIAWGEDPHGIFASFAVGEVEHRMRWIPPGTFWMGSPDDEVGRFDNEGPRRRVVLTQGYWLGETPVTQALWQVVMGHNPSRFNGSMLPVEQVSWDDSHAFCKRLSTMVPALNPRLPTEAEWERGCRAGTDGMTWAGVLALGKGGSASQLDALAWYRTNGGGKTHKVGEKEANPYGLYDMLGNVLEWCSDNLGKYKGLPALDPVCVDGGSSRIIRGGAWSSAARGCRASFRSSEASHIRLDIVGMRIAVGESSLAAFGRISGRAR